jgi:hypothetical protein
MLGPSFTTLMIRSTRNQLSNCDPILAMFPYRFRQLCVFCWYEFPLLPSIGRIQSLDPMVTTLCIRSTGKQRSNCYPVVAVYLDPFRQLCVFRLCPLSLIYIGNTQYVDSSFTTLIIRSTGNKFSNRDPVVAMFLYRFRQLCVFRWCPIALPPIGRIQCADPSFTTLFIRSTGNKFSKCGQIFAMFLDRFRKLCVLFWFPAARRCPGRSTR